MNFTLLRLAFGDIWNRFRISIYEKVDAVLDDMLSDKDVYLRTSDYFYLIAFDTDNLNQALTKLNLAKKIIMTHYLGSEFGKNIKTKEKLNIKASGQIIDSKSFLKDLDMISNLYPDQTIAETKELIQNSIPTNAASKAKMERKLEYQPLWDTKFEVTVGYQAYLKNIPVGQNRRYLTPYNESTNCTLARQNTDMETLEEVIGVIKELHLNKFVFLCNCPISFSTASNRQVFAKYVKRCKALPPEIQKLLNIELLEYPAGYPANKLMETVRIISPHVHNVILNTKLEDLKFYELAKEAGINVVSVDLSEKQEALEIEKLSHILDIFCSKLNKVNIDIALNGVSQIEAAIIARRNGVRYISGPLIGQVMDFPEHMSRFKWKEIKDSHST